MLPLEIRRDRNLLTSKRLSTFIADSCAHSRPSYSAQYITLVYPRHRLAALFPAAVRDIALSKVDRTSSRNIRMRDKNALPHISRRSKGRGEEGGRDGGRGGMYEIRDGKGRHNRRATAGKESEASNSKGTVLSLANASPSTCSLSRGEHEKSNVSIFRFRSPPITPGHRSFPATPQSFLSYPVRPPPLPPPTFPAQYSQRSERRRST